MKNKKISHQALLPAITADAAAPLTKSKESTKAKDSFTRATAVYEKAAVCVYSWYMHVELAPSPPHK